MKLKIYSNNKTNSQVIVKDKDKDKDKDKVKTELNLLENPIYKNSQTSQTSQIIQIKKTKSNFQIWNKDKILKKELLPNITKQVKYIPFDTQSLSTNQIKQSSHNKEILPNIISIWNRIYSSCNIFNENNTNDDEFMKNLTKTKKNSLIQNSVSVNVNTENNKINVDKSKSEVNENNNGKNKKIEKNEKERSCFVKIVKTSLKLSPIYDVNNEKYGNYSKISLSEYLNLGSYLKKGFKFK